MSVPIPAWTHYRLNRSQADNTRIVLGLLLDQTPQARLWRSHIPPPVEATIRRFHVRFWPEALVLAQARPAQFQDWFTWCPALLEMCICLLREPMAPAQPQLFPAGWQAVLKAAELPADRAMLHVLLKLDLHATVLVGLSAIRAVLRDRRKVQLLRHCDSMIDLEALRLLHAVPGEDIDANLLRMLTQPPAPSMHDSVLEQYLAVCRLRQWLGRKPFWPYRGVRISRDRLRLAVAKLEEQISKVPLAAGYGLPPAPLEGCADDDFAIEPLRTVASVREEAATMHNCLASYLPHILAGNQFAYRLLRPQRCTVLLSKIGDRWLLAEMRAFENSIPDEAAQKLVLDWAGLDPEDRVALEAIIPF
jgi:hypothetical protein